MEISALELPITVDEAAKLLGVHYKTLLRYISQGKLTAVVYGSREKRILPSDLQVFINASRKCTKTCTEPSSLVPEYRSQPLRVAPKRGAKPSDPAKETKWYEKFRG